MNPALAGAPIVTAAQMRAAEADCFAAGVSQVALMESAARAVAQQVARFARSRSVLVLAGPGNNGGDGFGVAWFLTQWGHDVTVATRGQDWNGAAAVMRDRWTGPATDLDDATPRPVLVDGLFGIGLTRPIAAPVRDRLAVLAAAAELVVAIDVPSGSFADQDASDGVQADITVALGALKPCHVVGDTARCGHVILADLAIAVPGDTRMIARPVLQLPSRADHKYTRGLVLVIGGTMPGAARLAAGAAARGGAGYVVLASDDARVPFEAVVSRKPDTIATMLADPKLGAVVIGPGLGRDDEARTCFEEAAASDCPLVIDGDALALASIEQLARRTAPTILTPHSGEFDRLFGTGGGNKLDRTRDAARRSGAIVVHKGADTVIAAPDGQTIVAHPPAWLSTAGTGDVLAGLAAARMAASRDPMRAAIEAVWLHARAASLAGPAFVADELAMHLPQAIAECL
ncbi:NAD(P)H-hydrate dehydratase [Sphingomonas sp. S1-29]|uniref:NAD(P)H-hydrate dehydratase n=1 Tax=Sphingomonas sp. S1-29 TaxID=2991074 RepID=UPI002240B366|nr:NAD(P)H-hydrate dehydratase [Sphingomonas sp. S1-29]UZK69946.1 NAD(P)H-hydrate dehydratase [Sphingomonas sp. S1-29]